MRRRLPALAVAAAAVALTASSVVFAYEEEGHFFSSAAVLYSWPAPSADGGTPSPLSQGEVATLAAFCVQLPDQTQEYDAVQVMQHRLALGTRQTADWMQWVQEDLHALAGGSATVMRDCAAELVRYAYQKVQSNSGREAEDVCALGWTIHLLGDSFAHVHFEQPNTLYAMPFGHAADYHEPDLPFYETATRGQSWNAFVDRLRAALAEPAGGDFESVRSVFNAKWKQHPLERGSMQWFTDLFGQATTGAEEAAKADTQGAGRQAILAATRWSSATLTLPAVHGGFFAAQPACNAYVQGARASGAIRASFNCDVVWARYARLVAEVFSSASCRDAFANQDDWKTSTPVAGYPR